MSEVISQKSEFVAYLILRSVDYCYCERAWSI